MAGPTPWVRSNSPAGRAARRRIEPSAGSSRLAASSRAFRPPPPVPRRMARSSVTVNAWGPRDQRRSRGRSVSAGGLSAGREIGTEMMEGAATTKATTGNRGRRSRRAGGLPEKTRRRASDSGRDGGCEPARRGTKTTCAVARYRFKSPRYWGSRLTRAVTLLVLLPRPAGTGIVPPHLRHRPAGRPQPAQGGLDLGRGTPPPTVAGRR